YRSGPWKLVFKLGDANLEKSRGKATIPELYHLGDDQAEEQDVSTTHPDVVTQLTEEFQQLIDRGATRMDRHSANDTNVDFRTTQRKRWAE
ncbi:MAG: hypothetical protein KDA88_22165, partial [Planctomycetaceae bacterium]|nr:hypothetical protein [Planctomycetaceae bacterium]